MTKIPEYICSTGGNTTSYITTVRMPDSIDTIGGHTFYNCTAIKDMALSANLKLIENYAYDGCSGLREVSFPETLTEIEGSAFSGSGLEEVTLPSSIKTVGSGAFSSCASLKKVSFTEKTANGYQVSVGDGAFQNCGSLSSVDFSVNVTSIGDYVFYGDSEIETIILPSKLTSIGYQAFQGTYISSITIPKTVTSCGSSSYDGPLAGATQLKEVVFEDGMKKIPNYACSTGSSYSSYITKAVIPESVTDIGSNAFYKCDNLTIYGYKNSYAESYAITESIPFVSVAIAKNASPEDVLKKMNLNTLVNNISFAGTNISGPTVTIAGKTFSLFSVPASMDIKLGDKVQAKVDDEKKTIQVLIGFNDFSGSAKLDPSENSSAYWSESYKQVKSLYTGVTGNKVDSTKLWNQFSKLRGKLKKMNCSMGVSASASAAGYIEFSYASGEIVYSSGGVVLEANLGASVDYKLPPCPAVYVTFGVEAGFNGKLSLVRESAMNYTPAINAGIDLTATLGVGAGSKKLKTYAEIGLKGTLGVDVSLPSDSLSDALLVKLTAYAYFNSKVFGFDGPNWGPEEFAGTQLYPRSRERSIALFEGQDLVNFDLNSAVPSDRSYLNMPVAFSLNTENTLYSKDNLYRYSAPQLVNLNDGSMLLLWIDDNGDKSDVNKTSLMYSVYDGSSWSGAEAIAETGGANDYPAVWSNGQKVQIVWQKAVKQSDQATLTDVLESVELYTVTYENGSFSETKAITAGNSTYEMMQSIAGNGESMAVVWMENSENNPFQAEGTNTIKVSKYENGMWTESTVDSSITEVANLNASFVGRDLIITYESSADDEGSITMIQGNKKKKFAGSSAEFSGGILYYCTDDGLMSYDVAGNLTENVLPAVMGDFTVLDNGTNKMIVATEYTGFGSELVTYVFDRTTGTWSDKVTLTQEGKYIRDYSAGLDKKGNLTAALNFVEVDEDSDTIYGNASLKVMNFSDTEDLIVEKGAYFDHASLVPGGMLPLNFSVTNNGTKAVSEIQVDILDDNDTVLQSGTVPCAVGIGETADVSYNYTLPEVLINQTITIKAYTQNETKLTDNMVSVELGLADVAVGNMYLSGSSSEAVLKGEIQNLGCQDASEVNVTVYDDNEEGTVIGTADLGVVEKSGAKTFEIAIPEAYLNVNPLVSGNALYVVVSTSANEMDYSNNADTYLIKSAADQPLVMNFNELTLGSNDSETLDVTYSSVVDVANEAITWTSSDESVITVKDGKLTAVGTGEATVTAEIKGYTVSCLIKVNNNVAVTGIYLEESSVNILAGQTKQLTANILPANATNQKLTWESSNGEVATVSSSGLVQAIAVGTAEITAYSDDGYKRAACRVTVSQDPETIYKVTFSGGKDTSGKRPSALSGTAGTLVTLPENSYTKEGYHFIGWTDGKNTYEAGVSYRIPYRDVTLTAVWANDEKQEYTIVASCQTGGSITPNGEVIVSEGETQKFTIAAEKGYSISDVKVDGESVGVISEYTFEEVSANHTIEAFFNKDVSIKIEKIQLSQTEATLEKGKTLLLDAVITPKEAEDQQLKWISSNINVLSVEHGLVTAIGMGTAEITVESQDGSNAKASCKITVTKAAQIIQGTKKYQKKSSDKAFQLDAKLIVGDGKLSYVSSNQKVATVSGNGVVTLKGTGSTSITVTAAETSNYKSAVFKVNINVTANIPRKPAPGTSITDNKTKFMYVVTKQGKTVSLKKPANKKITKAVIPATVKLSGITYKVTGISANAFSGCSKLKTVTIGKNVTSIGAKAFYKCKKLTKLSIPSKVTKIEKLAFTECSGLKTVTIGKNVTFIGDKAFYKCKKLSKIVIPAKVKKIGKEAFSGCSKLKSITIKTSKLTTKSVGAKAFKGIYAKAVIKVPKKKKAAYKKMLRKKGIGKKVIIR